MTIGKQFYNKGNITLLINAAKAEITLDDKDCFPSIELSIGKEWTKNTLTPRQDMTICGEQNLVLIRDAIDWILGDR